MSSRSLSTLDEAAKRRLEIDEEFQSLTKSIELLQDDAFKTELESKLLLAKLKRERLRTLSVIARSQTFLADLEVLIVENELNLEVLKLQNSRKKCEAYIEKGINGNRSNNEVNRRSKPSRRRKKKYKNDNSNETSKQDSINCNNKNNESSNSDTITIKEDCNKSNS